MGIRWRGQVEVHVHGGFRRQLEHAGSGEVGVSWA